MNINALLGRRGFNGGVIKLNRMGQIEELHIQQSNGEALIVSLTDELSLSKAELVENIERRLGELLGDDLKEAFKVVAAKQNIKGGTMNIDRAHKSLLVILAHVLNKVVSTR